MTIKDKFAEYVFKKATELKRAKRETIAVSNARNIGILYDATHQHQVNIVKKFSDELKSKGKNISLLGFYNKKKLPPDFDVSFNKEIITRADLHWYGIPKKNSYATVANESFDLLINLYTWHCVPLLVISAASKAKFRVGRYFSDATNCFDLMLSMEGPGTLENFLTQLDEFSTKIAV